MTVAYFVTYFATDAKWSGLTSTMIVSHGRIFDDNCFLCHPSYKISPSRKSFFKMSLSSLMPISSPEFQDFYGVFIYFMPFKINCFYSFSMIGVIYVSEYFFTEHISTPFLYLKKDCKVVSAEVYQQVLMSQGAVNFYFICFRVYID